MTSPTSDDERSSAAAPAQVDFDIEIGPGSGREYPVTVKVGADERQGTLRFPFDQLALESRLDKLQIALLRSGSQHRRALSPDEQAVQEFGQGLFDALVTGEIRSLYDASQRNASTEGRALRLKLNIQSPELAVLPWEFLYDLRQAEFLCLSLNTPIVRFIGPKTFDPLPLTPPLRILGMIASPSDRAPLNVDDERRRIEKGIAPLQARGWVELHWLSGQTWRDLQKAMRSGPWHVFHFIGHGGFNRSADEGFITLADDHGDALPLYATQLARLLADHRFLRLVIVNACEAARVSVHDSLASPAAFLVRRGIPAALAMQYAISDRAAIEFAHTFYEALAENMPVDSAVAEARKAISIAMGKTVEWGTPVLYMSNPSGLLFNLRGSQGPATGTPPAPAEEIKPKPAQTAPTPKRSKPAKKSAPADSAPPLSTQAKKPSAKKSESASGRKKIKKPVTQAVNVTPVASNKLTPLELDIVRLLLAEKGDWAIGQTLKIDDVGKKVRAIQRKAEVSTRRDLMLWAMRQGIKPAAQPQALNAARSDVVEMLKEHQTAQAQDAKKMADLLARAAQAEAKSDWDALSALANPILQLAGNITLGASRGLQPADYHFFHGLSLTQQDKNHLALRDFDTALRHEVKAIYHFFRGATYSGLNDYEQAIASFSEAIKLEPRKADYHYLRGMAYTQKNETGQAIADFDRAIQLNPNNPDYYYARSSTYTTKWEVTLFGSSRYDEQILADLNQAIKLGPNRADYYDARCAIHYHRKRYQQALADAQRAIELDPRNGDYYISRGRVYKDMDNKEAARRDLQRAVDLGHPEAKKELAKLDG